jgi:hypothetical protein
MSSKTPSSSPASNPVEVQLLKEQTLEQRNQSQLLKEVVLELKKDKEEQQAQNTLASQIKTVNQKLQQQMVAFIIGGLALVGVFAWKQVIETVVSDYMPVSTGSDLRGKIVSAVVITLVVVLFTYFFSDSLGGLAASKIDAKIV